MSIEIATNEIILLNGKLTDFCARQESRKTSVWNRKTGKELTLPAVRYSLTRETPTSGVAGLTQFETDFMAAQS